MSGHTEKNDADEKHCDHTLDQPKTFVPVNLFHDIVPLVFVARLLSHRLYQGDGIDKTSPISSS